MRIDGRVRAGLTASTRFADIRVLDEIDSTNRAAREAALAGAPEGLVVVADRQIAGRGRAGRSWDAPAGAGLLVSILLRPAALSPDRLHLVTAAVGLAAVEAVVGLTGTRVDLKWPNDLVVGDRKLAGILAEALDVAPSKGASAVIVGIGINVASAPPGAAWVDGLAGRHVRRTTLLVELLGALERRLRSSWDEVASEYRAACVTVGQRVRVEGPPGTFEIGRAVRVDPDGRLVIVADGGERERALSVADVTHVRPAPDGDGPPGVGW